LGKGKAQLALTPFKRASSMAIQRSIPRLCTTIISEVKGVGNGV
jgi:hypothetical protein